MAAEDIRNIVDRCYVGGFGFNVAPDGSFLYNGSNTPNPLDGSNPASAALGSTAGSPISTPSPADVIQDLVGRCYAGPPISNTGKDKPYNPDNSPNPLDGQNPNIPSVPPDPDPDPSPAEVIQELVGRCYPGLPPLQPPPNIPEIDDGVLEVDFPILDWLNFIDQPPPGPKLVIKLADPNDPRPYIGLGNNDDCAEVLRLRVRGQVESLGNNRWRNTQTGKVLICKDTVRDQDLDWERCVRNTLDCFFKPYVGNGWKPSKASCSTHWPNNWSANLDRVCVKNCFPKRIPVYETYSGGKHTYSNQGSGTPAFYVLQDPVAPDPDNPLTVPLIYYTNSAGDGFMTTNPGAPDGPGQGERATMNAAGMVFNKVIGYVFTKGSDAISYMADEEQAEGLYRYYNGSDHMYTIDPELLWDFPQTVKGRNSYRIPKSEITANMMVTTDTEKGSAGYDNALGFYLADSNGPSVGYVIVPSAKSGSNINRFAVPAAALNNHQGGTMGFFLIPDGAARNSLSTGQVINFSPQSDGFRGDGIGTAQSNYCLFSDNRWNPGDKDMTKWKGRNKQLWEDLLNGDDDYDDLKFWHKVQWTSNGYWFEGIQCYVFENDAPEPVYRKIVPSNCDNRSLTQSFKDVSISRTDCGSFTPTILSEDSDWECRTCNGSYSTRLNDTQTYTVPFGGTFRIVSMGGITGGLQASCIQFRFRFKLNGFIFYTGDWVAQYWPTIGADLFDQDVILSPGDELTFEFLELVSGPHTGNISPSLALYNVDEGVFDSQFSINLSTVASDDDIGQYAGGTPFANPLNTSSTGAIRDMGMQFKPYNRKGSEWQPGSTDGEAWYLPAADNSDHSMTLVWSVGSRVSMHGTLQASPSHMGGHSRAENNRFMPNITGGYIDTGYLEFPTSEYEFGGGTDLYRATTGCYNQLLENYLVTRFESLSISGADSIKKRSPSAYAKGYVPWYELARASGATDEITYDAIFQNNWSDPGSLGFFLSPCTFTHDYVLDGEALQGAGNPTAAAKVRVGFTFYPARPPGQTTSRTKYYWQCVINIVDVISPGQGYSQGMSFDLQWPPPREKALEDDTQTPYYPNYTNGFKLPNRKIINWYEDTSTVKRVAKEAIYQESHNTNSPIWYFCSDRNKDRLRFRLHILETS